MSPIEQQQSGHHQSCALTPVDVAVIGAGMAGLSTAVYARQAGLSVRVFEKHSIPGGLCTSWIRKGYTFDYCVDFFGGSNSKLDMYDMWKNLGVIDHTRFQQIESFGRYVGQDGRAVNLYTDVDRLRIHLLSISPEDRKMINQFCRIMKKARHIRMSELQFTLKGVVRLLRSLPGVPAMAKWGSVSLKSWCEGFKSSLLKEAFPVLVGGNIDFPVAAPAIALAMSSQGSTAYPLGGSLPLAKAIETRGRSLGADYEYNCGVDQVIQHDGKAIGIQLEDGRFQQARYVISACDARKTFDRLLQGRVRSEVYEALFREQKLHPSILQVSLGVKIDPRWNIHDLPKKLRLPLTRPVKIDGREHTRIGLYQYADDPSMSPAGGVSIVVKFDGDYDYWNSLLTDREFYKTEKQRVLQQTLTALEEHFPGISERVEATDVATPASCVRYTDNWRGSSQGWVMKSIKAAVSAKELPWTFPEIGRFWLIGQWAAPGGGLPITARHGRDVIRRIRKLRS